MSLQTCINFFLMLNTKYILKNAGNQTIVGPHNIHSRGKNTMEVNGDHQLGGRFKVNYSFKFVHDWSVLKVCLCHKVCAWLRGVCSMCDWVESSMMSLCFDYWKRSKLRWEVVSVPFFFIVFHDWVEQGVTFLALGNGAPDGSGHGCFLPPSEMACCWSTVWWEISSVKHTPTHTLRTCVGVFKCKL